MRYVHATQQLRRRINDYITLEPTDLQKRLPLSPATVYRYVNGEATFWGAEVRFAYAVTSALTGEVKADYLWGRDETVGEPALGVAPPRLGLGLRYEPEDEGFFVEGLLHAVRDQERVARSRGEQPTEGYVTGDLKGGVELLGRATLQAGVMNVTGVSYVNHLNARNPFTGRPIPEPGRVFFMDLQVTF